MGCCCVFFLLYLVRCPTSYERAQNSVRKLLIPELYYKLAKFIMLMPATNARSERSFSALKRLKTCVRSSMGSLNNLMFIHIHQDRTDNMDLKLVSNDFIKNKEEFRKKYFCTVLMIT